VAFPKLIFSVGFGEDILKFIICKGDFGVDIFRFVVYMGDLGSSTMLTTPTQ
jgi:hypothetical protein